MDYHLYCFILGCSLPGRHTEQHDVFFCVGQSLSACVPALKDFWPEAQSLHIDCWRKVTNVNGFTVKVTQRGATPTEEDGLQLFFLNLGGYRNGQFEEFHSREIIAAANKEQAIAIAKKTPFYKQFGFKGAVAHVDDKYGVDIDELYAVEEILTATDKNKFRIIVTNELAGEQDAIHLGYLLLSKF